MTDPASPSSRPADPALPAWRWEPEGLALRPLCPVCQGKVIASGKRLTCLMVGYRHYDQPVEALIRHVLGRLGQTDS